jgi:hypothetical protein
MGPFNPLQLKFLFSSVGRVLRSAMNGETNQLNLRKNRAKKFKNLGTKITDRFVAICGYTKNRKITTSNRSDLETLGFLTDYA